MNNSSSIRTRRILGKVFITLGGVLLMGSAAVKLAQLPKVVIQLGALGFDGNRLTFIALLEVLSALLFMVPATRSVGLLMVSSFMGGAIAAHLAHGQNILQPAIFLTFLWLGAWLRHPGILWSFQANAPHGRQAVSSEHRNSALGSI